MLTHLDYQPAIKASHLIHLIGKKRSFVLKGSAMEISGKTVKIHLSTPLVSNQEVMQLKGKLHEKSADGFWIEVEGSKKSIFVPTHKVDFVEVL